MSWAAIIPQILGTAANHYQGIRNTLEAPARKRRFLGDAARDAQVTALRNQRHTDFFPTNAIDARYKADQVRREARENPAFAADPAAFMPFIQSGAQLSGSLYDEFNKPSGNAPEDPNSLKHYLGNWQPASSTTATSSTQYQTPANLGVPRTANFTPAELAPQKPWWQL